MSFPNQCSTNSESRKRSVFCGIINLPDIVTVSFCFIYYEVCFFAICCKLTLNVYNSVNAMRILQSAAGLCVYCLTIKPNHITDYHCLQGKQLPFKILKFSPGVLYSLQFANLKVPRVNKRVLHCLGMFKAYGVKLQSLFYVLLNACMHIRIWWI